MLFLKYFTIKSWWISSSSALPRRQSDCVVIEKKAHRLPRKQITALLTEGHPCEILIVGLYIECVCVWGGGGSGLLTAAGLQMGVSHIGPNTPQHRVPWDRWHPNMLHDPEPYMLYSWEPPCSRERCSSQKESPSLSADLSGEGSGSITSNDINLGEALCQLKVEGAIIWARAELASYWPSMCYCRMKSEGIMTRYIYSL